jgi:hypothetical protein
MWRTDTSNPNFVRNRVRMPQGAPALAPPLLRMIEGWIDQGAVNN